MARPAGLARSKPGSSAAPSDFRRYAPDEPWVAEVLDTLFGGPPPDTAELRELASPVIHATSNSAPFLPVPGTQDETVPFAQSQLMAARQPTMESTSSCSTSTASTTTCEPTSTVRGNRYPGQN